MWQQNGLVLISQQLYLDAVCWIQMPLLFWAAVPKGEALDKKSVKGANHTAAKSAELQLANWKLS